MAMEKRIMTVNNKLADEESIHFMYDGGGGTFKFGEKAWNYAKFLKKGEVIVATLPDPTKNFISFFERQKEEPVPEETISQDPYISHNADSYQGPSFEDRRQKSIEMQNMRNVAAALTIVVATSKTMKLAESRGEIGVDEVYKVFDDFMSRLEKRK